MCMYVEAGIMRESEKRLFSFAKLETVFAFDIENQKYLEVEIMFHENVCQEIRFQWILLAPFNINLGK